MTNETPKSGKTKRGNRLALALIVGAGLTAGGIFSVQAIAQTTTYQHFRLLTQGTGTADVVKAGWGGRRHRFSDMSDADIEKHIKRGVAHLAIEVDATDDQQQQIIAIVTPAVLEMKQTRAEMHATGEQLAGLLTAPVIDKIAVDALRVEKLAEVDQLSKEWTDVITEVAMVLTPDQREAISDRVEQFRSMRRWRH